MEDGEGYSSRSWTESEVINYIKTNQIADRVLTNYPDPVYILAAPTGGIFPNLVPLREFDAAKSRIEQADDGSYFALLYRDPRLNFSREDLASLPGLQLVLNAEDGAIFCVHRNGK